MSLRCPRTRPAFTTAGMRRSGRLQATDVVLVKASPLNARLVGLGYARVYQLRWLEPEPLGRGRPLWVAHQVAAEFITVEGAETWARNEGLKIVHRRGVDS